MFRYQAVTKLLFSCQIAEYSVSQHFYYSIFIAEIPTPPLPFVFSIVKIRYIPSSVLNFVVVIWPLSVRTTCIGSVVINSFAIEQPVQVSPITIPNANPNISCFVYLPPSLKIGDYFPPTLKSSMRSLSRLFLTTLTCSIYQFWCIFQTLVK